MISFLGFKKCPHRCGMTLCSFDWGVLSFVALFTNLAQMAPCPGSKIVVTRGYNATFRKGVVSFEGVRCLQQPTVCLGCPSEPIFQYCVIITVWSLHTGPTSITCLESPCVKWLTSNITEDQDCRVQRTYPTKNSLHKLSLEVKPGRSRYDT